MNKYWMMVLTLAALYTGGAQAIPMTYNATLTGAAENPPILSPGTSLAAVEYDPIFQTLSIDVSFANLLGSTTVAHIHCCTEPPGNIGVATPTPTFPDFPTGVTSGSYNRIFDLTLPASFNPSFFNANGSTATGAEAALAAGLANGKAYLNIHTTAFPGGEIRGFLTPVPEPGTYALLLLGLSLASRATRQRKA